MATPKPAAAAKTEHEEKNETCLDCHSDKDNVKGKESLVVDPKDFKLGPHTEENGVTCYDCHTAVRKVKDVTDHGKLAKPTCAGCHDADKQMMGSRHGRGGAGQARPTCMSCHGVGHKIRRVANKASPVYRFNQPKTCGKCHNGKDVVPTFMKSVHGVRLLAGKKKGQKEGPTCSDCHNPHDTMFADVLRNFAYKKRVTKACSKCHTKEAKVYDVSVHGKALLERDVYGAASCVDCHLSHTIQKVKDPKSAVFKTKTVEVCANCHADQHLIRRFKLKPDVVSTYEASFHGRARRLGDQKVAKCADCHGHHAIFAATDTRSRVHKGNLKKSCGTANCHPRATAKFLQGKIHAEAKTPANYWAWFVRQLYIWLIGLVIGGMIVHNVIDWIRKNINRARAQAKEPHVIRMTGLERVLHAMLAISFLTLVYTGFASMYPKAWWVVPLSWLSSDTEAARALIHRIAGTILTFVSIHHLWFIFFHKIGKEQIRELLPKPRDLVDVYQNI
ncbi:MAG: hypothetical protein KAI47_07415, partial [Deltaproteobacteria bacterium]|nr:hypothetical protein [Deltaproteobacteria bacterium]